MHCQDGETSENGVVTTVLLVTGYLPFQKPGAFHTDGWDDVY